MHRRGCLGCTGGLSLALAGCTNQGTPEQPAGIPEDSTSATDGYTIHPWQWNVMQGFPPSPEHQVTLENHEDSHERLR